MSTPVCSTRPRGPIHSHSHKVTAPSSSAAVRPQPVRASSSRASSSTVTAAAAAAAATSTLPPPPPIPPSFAVSSSSSSSSSVGTPLPARTPLTAPVAFHAGSSSPNYFGIPTRPSEDCFTSNETGHAVPSWSPASQVRSVAACSPQVVPVDSANEFERFRKSSAEAKASLTLSGGALTRSISTAANANANANSHSHSDTNTTTTPPKPFAVPSAPASDFFSCKLPPSPPSTSLPPKTPFHDPFASAHAKNPSSLSNGDLKLSPPKPRSPKRNYPDDEAEIQANRPRRNSPAAFTLTDRTELRSEPARPSDHSRKISMPPPKAFLSNCSDANRADTLPSSTDDAAAGQPQLATPQRVVNIIESSDDQPLVLDLRVSTQYSRARIAGALNLCIPTTLVKRKTFNVAKLTETFKIDAQKEQFQQWKTCKYIVVYDQDSSTIKDAQSCVHLLNKFGNEGWKGTPLIVKGGFRSFEKSFPSHVVSADQGCDGTNSVNSDDVPEIAPVIGGCPMPATKSAVNPFFGNIRQNMDLIGGVGQMPIKKPNSLSTQTEEYLPQWIQDVIKTEDEGQKVSKRFEGIEKREQKRLQDALSGNVVYGTQSNESCDSFQIAGFEKGTKNRYNNIWPYEHSRVKLNDCKKGECDYINANHIHAEGSNKHYIATQGPIPATFNDFWRIVWEQDARVIVMLTAEKEGGQIKAHNYWSGRDYGHLKLQFLSEHRAALEPSKIHIHKMRAAHVTASGRRQTVASQKAPPQQQPQHVPDPSASPTEQPHVLVRRFTLSNSKMPFERMREITQLQYSGWPDFGAPQHPAHLLGLVEQCDSVVRTSGSVSSSPSLPRPVIVHCSAGCGRTGTFCTVDTAIDQLRRQRAEMKSMRHFSPMDIDSRNSSSTASSEETNPFDRVSSEKTSMTSSSEVDLTVSKDDMIEQIVEDFRKQRLSMVQSLRQYVLCYESVLEWLVEQQPKTA